MKLNLSCREATQLVLQALDRRLPWHARLALRFHLLICKACPTFVRQTQLMQQATGAWRRYADSGELPDQTPAERG
jgi:hypothetical protein